MFFSHCPDVLDFLYGPKPCLLLLLALFLFFLLYETSVKPSSAIGCAVSPVVPAINFCWSCDMSFCLQSLLFMLALKLFGMVFALFSLSIVPVTNTVLIGDTLLLLFGFNCIFSVSGIITLSLIWTSFLPVTVSCLDRFCEELFSSFMLSCPFSVSGAGSISTM